MAACLRNAAAAAGWALGSGYGTAGRPIAVIAAGERWPDGSLDPRSRTGLAPVPCCTICGWLAAAVGRSCGHGDNLRGVRGHRRGRSRLCVGIGANSDRGGSPRTSTLPLRAISRRSRPGADCRGFHLRLAAPTMATFSVEFATQERLVRPCVANSMMRLRAQHEVTADDADRLLQAAMITSLADKLIAQNPCQGVLTRGGALSKRAPDLRFLGSGRRDSNPRPQPWQGCALPAEPRPRCPHRLAPSGSGRTWRISRPTRTSVGRDVLSERRARSVGRARHRACVPRPGLIPPDG